MILLLVLSVALLGIGSGQDYSTSSYATEARREDEPFPFPPYLIVKTAIEALLDSANEDSELNYFTMSIDQVKDEVCATTCEDRAYFDCDCRNAFDVYNSGKDECSDVLCDVISTYRGKIRAVLQKMRRANSYQEMVVSVLPLLEKLMNKVCNCRADLPVAIQGCMTGRSDLFNEMSGEIKRARWGLIRRMWASLMDTVCSRDCQLADTFHLVKLGKILDESTSGSGSCLDFTDVYNGIASYFYYIDERPTNRLVDVIWCSGSKKCNRELEKKFNTCCFGNLAEVFNDRWRSNLMKVMARMAEEEDESSDEFQHVRWVVDSIGDAFDPEKSSCSRTTRSCEEE